MSLLFLWSVSLYPGATSKGRSSWEGQILMAVPGVAPVLGWHCSGQCGLILATRSTTCVRESLRTAQRCLAEAVLPERSGDGYSQAWLGAGPSGRDGSSGQDQRCHPQHGQGAVTRDTGPGPGQHPEGRCC